MGRLGAEKRRRDSEERARRKDQEKLQKLIDYQPITIAGLDDEDQRIRDIAQQAQDMLDDRRRRGIPPQGVEAEAVAA